MPLTVIKNITDRFSSGVRRAAVVFLARSLNSFLALIFSLIAGKILSVEDHGLYGQAMARIIVFQAFLEVGLQYSLVRFLTPAIKEKNASLTATINSASLLLKLYAFLAVGGVTLLFIPVYANMADSVSLIVPFVYPDGILILWMVFLGGAGMSLISYLDALLVSHQYYFRLSLWLPGVGILRLFFIGLLFFLEDGDISGAHVVYIFSIVPYFVVILFFLFFSPSFFFQKPTGDIQFWLKKLFSYNLWILAASFFSITSDWMEILLITNTRDSGLYNAARLPMQGFLILLATMQSILLPRFSVLETKSEYLAIFKRIYKYIIPLTVMFLPGLWIFALFIPAWYGEEYLPSVQLLYVLYPSFLLRMVFAPLGTALFALDQPRIITIEAGLRMMGGLVLNLILIPEFGIMGAAFANFFSQFAGWAFLIYCYYLYFTTERFPLNKK
ncbi:MAG: polysaccharide biosynthesis C-terminal domain-containing protein [Spirochaetia bacterium]|nr:polysaccharide biosynthesis C-terminal domain-containing protein [Spirochaetia bacterium]